MGWGLLALIWAEGEDTSSSVKTGNPILDALIQLGIIGIVMALAAFGYIWFKPSVEALKEDKKLLQQINADLISTYEKQVIPALHEAVSAMGAMASAVKDTKAELKAELRDVRSDLATQREEVTALRGNVVELVEVIRQLQLQVVSNRGGSTP